MPSAIYSPPCRPNVIGASESGADGTTAGVGGVSGPSTGRGMALADNYS